MNTASDLPEGTLLGERYRLGNVLGRGGMAVVYRAEDELLTRQVAVKVISGASATPDALQRQYYEAQIGAKLNHSGLVAVYDVQPNATPPFIVMELVEGMTLADALKRGTLRPAAVGEIGAQLCTALAAVHEAGIVHRDIKPSNVMLVSDEAHTVKLTDFGISLLLDATRITAAGNVVGTVRYLSPEQVTGQPVDRPTDIYALGLVLIECLTGKSVFPGTQTETMSARLHRGPEMPTNVGPDWIRVLSAMTAREASERPDARTAGEALRALAEGRTPGPLGVAGAAAATQAVAAPPPPQADQTRALTTPMAAATPGADPTAATPAATGGDERRRRGRTVLLAVLAAVAIIIIGSVLFAALPDGDSGDDTPDDSPTTGRNDQNNNDGGETGDQGTTDTGPTSEPTQTTTDEPTSEPTETSEPTSEPTETSEPTSEPTETSEPTSEPTETSEPTAEPTQETTLTPDSTDATSEPTPEGSTEGSTDSTSDAPQR